MEIQGQEPAANTKIEIPEWGSFGADSTIAGVDAVAGDDQPVDDTAKEAKPAPAADADNPDGKAAEEAQEPAPEKRPDPLLVATAPADADAQLKAIADQKLDLASEFDDGELTSREYMEQVDKLNKQERQIERQIEKAELAAEMAQQQAHTAFLNEVANFTAGTPYVQSKAAWEMLDAAVRQVALAPENSGLTGRQVLEKAHAEVLKDPIMAMAFSAQKPAPAKPAATPENPTPATKKPAAPVTLAHVPAAEISEAGEARFAVIERIKDPEARAEAVAKMSTADRNAYLKGAA